MANEQEWWTSPAESDNGRLVMVTGRRDVDEFRNNPRFKYRVLISWPYDGDSSGMPSEALSEQMGAVEDELQATFKKDPVAVLTGIYTGDGRRDWVFYTLSLNIFQKKINEALASFPQLPLEFEAYEDPTWEEYQEMKDATEIN